jgi:hypothetical protein
MPIDLPRRHSRNSRPEGLCRPLHVLTQRRKGRRWWSVDRRSDEEQVRREKVPDKKRLPELYQVVVECRDEVQQRELFERIRREGLKVRLLVL